MSSEKPCRPSSSKRILTGVGQLTDIAQSRPVGSMDSTSNVTSVTAHAVSLYPISEPTTGSGFTGSTFTNLDSILTGPDCFERLREKLDEYKAGLCKLFGHLQIGQLWNPSLTIAQAKDLLITLQLDLERRYDEKDLRHTMYRDRIEHLVVLAIKATLQQQRKVRLASSSPHYPTHYTPEGENSMSVNVNPVESTKTTRRGSGIGTFYAAEPRAPEGSLEWIANRRLHGVPTRNLAIRKYSRRSWNKKAAYESLPSQSASTTSEKAEDRAGSKTFVASSHQPEHNGDEARGVNAMPTKRVKNVVAPYDSTQCRESERDKVIKNRDQASPIVATSTSPSVGEHKGISQEQAGGEERIDGGRDEGIEKAENGEYVRDLFREYGTAALPRPSASYVFSTGDFLWIADPSLEDEGMEIE